jgi:hypothetical protein
MDKAKDKPQEKDADKRTEQPKESRPKDLKVPDKKSLETKGGRRYAR